MSKPLTDFVTGAGTVPLYHYASVNGDVDTITTDPSRFAENKWTKGDRQASNVPRTFFYLDPNDREGYFAGRTLFRTEVPAHTLYDLNADPKRVVARIAARGGNPIGKILLVLKRLGHRGVYYSGSFPTVNLFEPVRMTRHVPAAEPTRLARADVQSTEAQGVLNRVRESIEDGNGDSFPHEVFADYLADAGDPHEYLVRRHAEAVKAGHSPLQAAEARAVEIALGRPHPPHPFATDRDLLRNLGVAADTHRTTGSRHAHERADPSAYTYFRYRGPAGVGHFVGWRPTPDGPYYMAGLTHAELKDFVRRIAPEERRAFSLAYSALGDRWRSNDPAAPINDTHISWLSKRNAIRDRNQLARKWPKRYCPECNAPVFRVSDAGTARCARGHEHPHSQTRETPRKARVQLAATKAPRGGAIVNNQYQKGGQFLPRAMLRIRDAVRRVWRLARTPATPKPPAAPVNMLPVVQQTGHDLSDLPLSVEQVAHIERTHDVPADAKLSTRTALFDPKTGRFHPGKTSPDHLYKFFEAIGNSRLADHDIHHLLSRPDLADQLKTVYLVNHLAAEGVGFRSVVKARHGDDAGEWYGSEMHLFDRGWHHLFERHNQGDRLRLGRVDPKTGKVKGVQPGLVLARLLLAITSPGTNPEINLGAARRMLEAGVKRAGGLSPYRTIPTHNTEGLADWKAAATALHGSAHAAGIEAPGHEDPNKPDDYSKAADWYKKYVLPTHGTDQDLTKAPGGYKSRPVGIIHLPDQPDHPLNGKWVYAERGIAKAGKPTRFVRNEELVQGVPLHKFVNSRSNLRKAVVKVDLPIVDGFGRLQPKNWTAAPSVAEGVQRLHRVLDHFGGDIGKVAKFLLTDHDIKDLRKITGTSAIDRGTLEDGEAIPGSFAFGPKVGAFFQNLLGNYAEHAARGKFLTTDLWWQRMWNRAVNLYRKTADQKSGAYQEAPRGPVERRTMAEAAEKARARGGFDSVAQLQATLWYYEQQLWRWFGANAPSRSFKTGINKELRRDGHDPLELIDGVPTFVPPAPGA